MSDQHQTHKTFLSELKAAFTTSLAQHPANTSAKDLLLEIKSYIISLNNRSARIYNSEYRAQDNRIIGLDDASTSPLLDEIDVGENDFRHLWFMVIEVAKITPADDSEQDSLVCLLLYFRGLGTLAGQVGDRNTSRHGGVGIWLDLPFLASALLDTWKEADWSSDIAMNNLAAFTGRCVALGVEGAEKAALWLLRNTLEVDNGEKLMGGNSLRLDDWLFACAILLEHCGHHVLTFCIQHRDVEPEDAQLLRATEGRFKCSGFSLERWLLWRKSLQGFSGSGNIVVAKNGKRGFEAMIGCGRELGFIVDGEGKYFENVYEKLREEMRRSGKESVGLEDIITDPNWAE